jgi:hypothetical protein
VEIMITVTNDPTGSQIRLDGWLAGAGVAELARVLGEATAPARLLVRDLRGADAAGLSTLRRIAEQGTPLEGVSPYIELLLARLANPAFPDALSSIDPNTPVRSNEI